MPRLNGTYSNAYDFDYCGAIYQGRRDDSSCIGFHNLVDALYGFTLGLPTPADQKSNGETVVSNPINRLDNEWTGYNLNIDWDLGNTTLQIDHVLLRIRFFPILRLRRHATLHCVQCRGIP